MYEKSVQCNKLKSLSTI